MREFVLGDEDLATFFDWVNPYLDERQPRVLAGSVARTLGRGGIVAVAEATGMSRSTVQGAVAQVDEGMEVSDRVPGKFDQDFGFGSEGVRDAFYLVKLIEGARREGMRHFDAHPYRTEDAAGVWEFAASCMRTYLILADKARRFAGDVEIQAALKVAKAEMLGEATLRDGISAASLEALRAETRRQVGSQRVAQEAVVAGLRP